MTRGVVAKRPRMGHTSPTSHSTTASLPYPSRPFTASSQPVNGATAVSSATNNTGVSTSATISTTCPAPAQPQPQHHPPAPQYHHPPPSTQDLGRSSTTLSLNQNSTSSKGHPGNHLTISTSQQPAPSGAIHAPSPTTNLPSASYPPPHLERYPQSNGLQQSAPSSATQPNFPGNQRPQTNLPPPASPSSAPPGNSASAPPYLAHPPPPHHPPSQAEYYSARGPYPGPQPPYPAGTPTNGNFASRQQSAPTGAPPPPDPMIMDHAPSHHQPVYGRGPYPAEHGANDSAHGVPHSGAPPPYQPVQPVDQYGAPPNVPQSYSTPPIPPSAYQHAAGTASAANWSAQQKGAGIKKHTRAHVACNACRQRKQKCDEATPSCAYCLSEGVPCEYRQVQPPKADRNLSTIQDAQARLENEVRSMRGQMADVLRLLRSQHNIPSINGHTSPRTESARLTSEHTEEVDIVQEQAPGAHSTGAQHLSKKFPLTEPWFKAAVKQQNYESYPYELEQQRGTPRIFGTGWSGDEMNARNERNTAYNNSFQRASHPAKNKGGLNPNGSLRLDQSTVKKYHDSYMRNMWIMYPIFNAEDLKERMVAFCALYSPDEDIKSGTPPLSQYSAHSPHASGGLKRSFSEMQGESDDPGHCGDPKRPVDSSLNNAVILLILALGKLCEHDRYIMTEELVGKSDPFPEDAGSRDSSPNYARPSSTRSTNSSSSPKYPNNIMNNTSGWQDMHVPPNAKNVHKLPGLGYYAEAASILGQTMGRRGPDAIHAYILAGLYWGQLGHVLQSADWIHMAANSVIELLYSFPPEDLIAPADTAALELFCQRPLEERRPINSFLIAFWTVQQMEGDILAELERLPTSRLADHLQIGGEPLGMPHDLVGVPDDNCLSLFNGTIDIKNILYHFLNQLTLRKYLNRAHLSLYGTQEQQREAATGRQRTLTWGDLQPAELWQTVKEWRKTLPEALKWSDEDPPPNDILHARLRAKYYGFVYIVSRKVLETVARTNAQVNTNDFENVRFASLDDLQARSVQSEAVDCKRCILSAIASTIAFDNACDVPRKRAMLPNIMGTFTAQFSNMLVLSCCILDPRLRPLIPDEVVIAKLLQRTIRVLYNLSPLSPVFETNKEILLKAYEAVSTELMRTGLKVQLPVLDQRNLVAGSTWVTPPTYGSPGVQSAGRSSQGPGTPRFDHISSANTSFTAPR